MLITSECRPLVILCGFRICGLTTCRGGLAPASDGVGDGGERAYIGNHRLQAGLRELGKRGLRDVASVVLLLKAGTFTRATRTVRIMGSAKSSGIPGLNQELL